MSNRLKSALDHELADFLARVKLEKGWTYAQMAKETGVDGSTIHRIVSGEHLATLWLVWNISYKMKTPLSEMFPKATKARKWDQLKALKHESDLRNKPSRAKAEKS